MVNTTIPKSIVAGMTYVWTLSLAYLPVNGWTLMYSLRGPVALDLTATVSSSDPDDFDVEMSVAQSTTLTPGRYFYQAYVVKGSANTNNLEKHLVDNGEVVVAANLQSTTGAYDGRSRNEKTLEAITAMMERKATKDQASYTIGQRTISKMSWPDLVEAKKYYTSLVNLERRQKAGIPILENIVTKFGDN